MHRVLRHTSALWFPARWLPQLWLPQLCLGICCIGSVLQGQVAPEPAPRPAIGDCVWSGHAWFQYLGEEDGQGLWLYPHLDGIFEIFRDPGAGTIPVGVDQVGDLGSRIASTGEFTSRFCVGEVLNRFLAARSRRVRCSHAETLAYFARLHGGLPEYLARYSVAIDSHLGDASNGRLEALLTRRDRLLARTGQIGVRVPSLRVPDVLESSDDHYRALVADGYLDIAVLTGNLYAPDERRYWGKSIIEEMQGELRLQGFVSRRVEDGARSRLFERTVRLFGQPIRVRVRAVPSSKAAARVRMSVACFVEGFAHADVVLYAGHSNRRTGSYWLSESKSMHSRFRFGGSAPDVHRRLHRAIDKRYQLVALMSCSSWTKYCLPLRRAFAGQLSAKRGADIDGPRIGWLGVAANGHMDEIVPRYARLIELLTRGAGGFEIAQSLERTRKRPSTPSVVLRGFLQAEGRFILPRGVRLLSLDELSAERGAILRGIGDDGQRYYSSDSFPQSTPGEIVQVVPYRTGLLGLRRDGRLYQLSFRDGGAAVEAVCTADSPRRFRSISRLDETGRMALISRQSELFLLDSSLSSARRLRLPVPAGLQLAGLAMGPRGRWVARTSDGARWIYSQGLRALPLRWLEGGGSPREDPSLIGSGAELRHPPASLPQVQEKFRSSPAADPAPTSRGM